MSSESLTRGFVGENPKKPRGFRRGAGGGIRTHEDLSQRILSPPPCPRGHMATFLDLARVPLHQPPINAEPYSLKFLHQTSATQKQPTAFW